MYLSRGAIPDLPYQPHHGSALPMRSKLHGRTRSESCRRQKLTTCGSSVHPIEFPMAPHAEDGGATAGAGARIRSRGGLHPTPFTIHPTPYTKHTTHYTLHPTPYTLHPSHYTLHLTPYTSHNTHYTAENGGATAGAGPRVRARGGAAAPGPHTRVCVCMCGRERERESKREKERAAMISRQC
jgi:hypothetical protein